MEAVLLLIAASMLSSVLNVRDFGAVPDGKTLCTAAIQKAIDTAAQTPGTRVDFPGGEYLSGSIHLRSGVEIHIEKGATLLGSPFHKDYQRGTWNSLILAANLHDVSITGGGTIDGQGALVAQDILKLVQKGVLKIPPKSWRPSELDRPEIIEMNDCRNIKVSGVTIKNGCCWVQTYRNCDGMVIDGIKVDSKTYWNNDGIDIVDCRNCRVSNSFFDADDDGICLKSDNRKSRCENIEISKCRIRSSASAIKFGTASHGGFHHIRIHDIDIFDTFRSALALESVDGGILDDVVAERIKARHTGNAFFIRIGHRNLRVPPGQVRNIVLRDFDVEVPAGRPDFGYPFKGPQFSEPHNICPASIIGHRDQPIEGITLSNIKIRMPGGGNPAIAHVYNFDQVPERPTEYPEFTNFGELPAWGLYIRHAKGITLDNFALEAETNDYRVALAADDVHGFTIKGSCRLGRVKRPTIVVHNVKGIHAPINIKWQTMP